MRSLRVVPVAGRREKKRFLRAPLAIFAHDPCHIQPLEVETAKWLDGRGCWFDHAHMQSWVACRGNRVVGRISAMRDRLHPDPAIGQFGFLDAINDVEVFRVLLDTAGRWLSEQGAKVLQGPFDPSINVQVGLLVDGFDTPPYMLMGHALPYYRSRYADRGLRPVQNLYAYDLDSRFESAPSLYRLARRYRPELRIRQPDWSNRDEEMRIMCDIFNDAWRDNWGFVPFTEDEFREMGREMRPLLRPNWAHIVEYRDEPVGFIVMLPDLNHLIADFRGRLLPFNLFRLLYRLLYQPPVKARVPLMGVRRRLQDTPLAAAVAFLMIEQLQIQSLPEGLRHVELSWILEDNKGMHSIIQGIEGRIYKHYQVFEKPLA